MTEHEINEILEWAEQNGALIPPEEAEKHRQETIEYFERHQLHTGYLGGLYFVDTHSLGYMCYKFFLCLILFLVCTFITAVYVLKICNDFSKGEWIFLHCFSFVMIFIGSIAVLKKFFKK
ncbi:MAG: hypothetical protein LBK82_12080 [Planctomycetaceae bacterium]|jgi:hypothetical protein|nr:hypothetical protein [Planctomycetaceae bacterium]